MSETPHSDEDEFAELYRTLPGRTAPEDAPSDSPAPSSRRAARQAAERQNAAPSAASAPSAPREARAGTVLESESPSDTLDALFEDSKGARGSRAKGTDADRRKGRAAGWVIFLLILALIGGAVWGGYQLYLANEDAIRAFMGWEESKDYEEGIAEGEVLVSIVPGDTGYSISETLHASGVTKTEAAFYDYLRESAQNPTFQPGVYALQLKMSAAAALNALQDPESRRDNVAAIPEGTTVATALEIVSGATEIPLEELQAAAQDPSAYGVGAQSLEGWLFPATYTFDPGITAAQAIQTMVDRTRQALSEAGVPEERQQEILTIASIIEREARMRDDFYRVSRVIQNRLDAATTETNGLLQMDSTAQYGYGETHSGSASSSAGALADDNLWNTYVHPGLPVGPIANPGDLAIDAAMNPADGPWLYFVTINLDTGETVFSETMAEHEAAIELWEEWCRENRPGETC